MSHAVRLICKTGPDVGLFLVREAAFLPAVAHCAMCAAAYGGQDAAPRARLRGALSASVSGDSGIFVATLDGCRSIPEFAQFRVAAGLVRSLAGSGRKKAPDYGAFVETRIDSVA